MWYLFFEIWVWLLVAFVLGWLAHWLLCCRGEGDSKSDNTSTAEVISTALAAENSNPGTQDISASTDAMISSENVQPLAFSRKPDQTDDLKKIKGIGAVLEQTLNGLGVYQFSQIASWNEDNIEWVNDSLSFSGRIQRENWCEQAKILSEGGSTEFSNRSE